MLAHVFALGILLFIGALCALAAYGENVPSGRRLTEFVSRKVFGVDLDGEVVE